MSGSIGSLIRTDFGSGLKGFPARSAWNVRIYIEYLLEYRLDYTEVRFHLVISSCYINLFSTLLVSSPQKDADILWHPVVVVSKTIKQRQVGEKISESPQLGGSFVMDYC